MSNVADLLGSGGLVQGNFISNGKSGANATFFYQGTSSNYLSSSSTAAKFIEQRVEATAITGDIRGIYTALKFTGSTGTTSGEAGRFRTILERIQAGAYGIHGGLEMGAAAGSVTGLAAGIRSTLMLPNRAMTAAGTYYGGITEIWSEGSSSDISPVTAHAIHCFSANGNATGAATVKNLWSINGVDGASEMIYTAVVGTPANTAGHLLVTINATQKKIYFYDV